MGNKCKLSEEYEKVGDNLTNKILETSIDHFLPEGVPNAIRNSINTTFLNTEDSNRLIREEGMNEWKKTGFPNTRESFIGGREGFDVKNNYNTLSEIKNALESRSAAFLNDPELTENGNVVFNEFRTNQENDINKLKNMASSMLKSYKTLELYKLSIGNILKNKLLELGKYKNKSNTYKQNAFIDERKNLYINNNYEFYKNIYFYVLIIYYVVFIVLLFLTNSIIEKLKKNKYLIVLIIFYLILPFILKYILSFIYDSYINILEYNNMRNEIISYPYIVQDKEKHV